MIVSRRGETGAAGRSTGPYAIGRVTSAASTGNSHVYGVSFGSAWSDDLVEVFLTSPQLDGDDYCVVTAFGDPEAWRPVTVVYAWGVPGEDFDSGSWAFKASDAVPLGGEEAALRAAVAAYYAALPADAVERSRGQAVNWGDAIVDLPDGAWLMFGLRLLPETATTTVTVDQGEILVVASALRPPEPLEPA